MKVFKVAVRTVLTFPAETRTNSKRQDGIWNFDKEMQGQPFRNYGI